MHIWIISTRIWHVTLDFMPYHAINHYCMFNHARTTLHLSRCRLLHDSVAYNDDCIIVLLFQRDKCIKAKLSISWVKVGMYLWAWNAAAGIRGGEGEWLFKTFIWEREGTINKFFAFIIFLGGWLIGLGWFNGDRGSWEPLLLMGYK